MSKKNLMNQYNGSLENLLSPKERYIFLVGAGISIDPPAKLLPAPKFIKYLLGLCAPEEEIVKLRTLDTLRYEMIAEIIQRYIDSQLDFMDYFELKKNPNLNHLFLANAIKNGHSLYTTNFDYLIEYALMQLLPKEKKTQIIPVITEKDFIEHQIPSKTYSDGKFPVYKLHGAKRNVITNIKTTDSLITTMSSFGKGDKILCLKPFKRDSIMEASKDQTLIVLGYSGSDDFDIAPMLRRLFDIKCLIWIDHRQEEDDQMYEFDPKAAFVIPKGLSRTERLLAEISSNTETQVILIKTHTRKFIENKLWNLLLPEIKLPKAKDFEATKEADPPPFESWVMEKFSKVPETLKWKCTADIYLELGLIEEFLLCAKKGLNIAQNAKSQKMESEFLNLLGVYHFNQKDFDLALEYFEKALEVTEQSGFFVFKPIRINNIGLVHFEKGNFEKALELFQKAFELGRERGDFGGMAARLNNMGLVYLKQEEYDKALDKFKEALKLDMKVGNLPGRTMRLSNLGELSNLQGNHAEALNYYRDAYSIVQKLSDRLGMGKVLIEMGKTYSKVNDFGKAINNLKKAITFLKEAGDKINLFEAEEALKEVKQNLK